MCKNTPAIPGLGEPRVQAQPGLLSESQGKTELQNYLGVGREEESPPSGEYMVGTESSLGESIKEGFWEEVALKEEMYVTYKEGYGPQGGWTGWSVHQGSWEERA